MAKTCLACDQYIYPEPRTPLARMHRAAFQANFSFGATVARSVGDDQLAAAFEEAHNASNELLGLIGARLRDRRHDD